MHPVQTLAGGGIVQHLADRDTFVLTHASHAVLLQCLSCANLTAVTFDSSRQVSAMCGPAQAAAYVIRIKDLEAALESRSVMQAPPLSGPSPNASSHSAASVCSPAWGLAPPTTDGAHKQTEPVA